MLAHAAGPWHSRQLRCGPAARSLACAVAGLMALTLPHAAAQAMARIAWPEWARDLERSVNDLNQLAAVDDAAWARLPQINARERGAIGDGKADDTAALQAALNSLPEGGTLLLDGGTFVHSGCLHIPARVRLLGRGARLHARNPNNMCVSLEGIGSQLRGLELTAQATRRGSKLAQARVLVQGRGAKVIDNRVIGATAAGIMIRGARDFSVTGNYVAKTLSDGIHSTDGAVSGCIARNVTDETGDDGIAVVSYLNSPRCAKILIEENSVSNISWARGISVVGSADVVVRRNKVTGTGRAAGIIVTREDSFNTYGVDRVIVADNAVSEVARRFNWAEKDQTGQATIDVNAYAAPVARLQVRKVVISGNTLADGRTDGIRLLGGVCETTITDNQVQGMGGVGIALVDPTCADPIYRCAGNKVDWPSAAPLACHAP